MLLRRSVDPDTRNKQSLPNISYAIVGRQLLQQPDDHAASVHFESTETAQKDLQRSLIFPIVHLRRLRVAIVLSITRTA